VTDIAGERARLEAQGLQITRREQWGAQQDYRSDRRVNWPAKYLFLHITVTTDPADTPDAEAAACRQVEAIGQSRFGIGWSYNGGVMQSGRLYEGQPLTRRGAHTVNDLPNPSFPTGSLNYDARALALVQNVQDAVTDVQIDSAARWGAALRRSGEAVGNARWYGHRDVTQKSCPGPIAYARLGELNALTDHYTAVGLHPPTPKDWFDMATKEDLEAVVAAEAAEAATLRLVRHQRDDGFDGLYVLNSGDGTCWFVPDWFEAWQRCAFGVYSPRGGPESQHGLEPPKVGPETLQYFREIPRPVAAPPP
jgi:hypothetical protein